MFNEIARDFHQGYGNAGGQFVSSSDGEVKINEKVYALVPLTESAILTSLEIDGFSGADSLVGEAVVFPVFGNVRTLQVTSGVFQVFYASDASGNPEERDV